jgi:hypothetical protein
MEEKRHENIVTSPLTVNLSWVSEVEYISIYGKVV